MRFIHAADIHLDSPLRGLEAYPGAPAERLRIATRQAFDRVVDLCLEERVDFLIVAGDLFDTEVKDFHSALAAAEQLRRLYKASIPVYLILGNHDSLEEATRHVPWPANVTLFDHKRPQTVRHPTLPVALHGMSYPKRDVTENLVPGYPASVAGCFNIGLLHTNAGGNSQHAAYAPCSVEELVAKRYDYWALGHVHDFAVLHERPHVVYSGNTQGRHARETGPKGCLLVTVDERANGGEVREVEFRETDLVRWFRETIPLQPDDDEDALLDATRNHLREIVSAADGRLAAVRLEFTGRCAVHAQLAKDASRQQLVTNLRALASDFGDDVWIEKIKFHTQSPLDLDALRERQDLIGQLLRDIKLLKATPQSLLDLPETKDLSAKVSAELTQDTDGEDTFNLDDPTRHVGWLCDAEALLLSHLVQESGSQS
ncbi:MAG: DNA repair exonuclease [Candidatus Saccharimonas sp.]|nr:DNA repair exonuclease [Planctomycetaceae bacterium]